MIHTSEFCIAFYIIVSWRIGREIIKEKGMIPNSKSLLLEDVKFYRDINLQVILLSTYIGILENFLILFASHSHFSFHSDLI